MALNLIILSLPLLVAYVNYEAPRDSKEIYRKWERRRNDLLPYSDHSPPGSKLKFPKLV
jgi:hypothetical protein